MSGKIGSSLIKRFKASNAILKVRKYMKHWDFFADE